MVRNIIVVIAVIALVAGVAWYKSSRSPSPDTVGSGQPPATPTAGDASPDAEPGTTGRPSGTALPRMVDLGSDQCKACKAMKPILDELQKTYAGKAEVEFIDVYKMPIARQLFGIRAIPTQIFYNREGDEVWRHEGFLSKEEIVTKLKELGA